MKTAILTVGTEILFGQIVNSNAAFLSRELNQIGYDVMYHYSVGDNPKRLEETINIAFKDCDLIITTGGLGPTQDDLTKEIIAKAMGDILVEDPKCLEDLKAHFAKFGRREMTENNLKQAMMPKTAKVLPNDSGTAPGFALEKDGKIIIALPGPPREMTRMFELQVRPYLLSKQDSVIYYKILRTFGIGESQMETVLLPLIDAQTDPTLATYAKEGECSLRIASKRKTLEEAKDAVDEMILKVEEYIGKYIYSYDDEDLIDVVANKLIENNITISAAESCTGGMFASTLTNVPGISKIFKESYVTYSNQAKIDILNVNKDTLEKYGAVSKETAYEMALGLRNKTNADIAISVTGIAGPDGGSDEKPVGTTYIGISTKEDTYAILALRRNVNRLWNRRYTVLSMLDQVNKIIDKILAEGK